MNGKEMLEAMSFVDEKYIMEAEQSVSRKFRWQPLAALAACAAIAILALRIYPGRQTMTAVSPAAMQEYTAEIRAEPADEDGGAGEPMAMMAMGFLQVTVRIDRYEDGDAVCIVTDPGSSSYAVGAEIRIPMPEPVSADTDGDNTAEAGEETAPAEENFILFVTGTDEDLRVIDIVPAEPEE